MPKPNRWYKEALEICQKVLGREHPDTATKPEQSGGALSGVWATMPKPNRCTERPWRFARKSLAGSIPIRRSSLNNLAVLELDLGQIQEAKRLAQLGYAANLKVFSQILSFGSEDQRLAYQRLLDPYTLFAAFDDTDAFLADAVLHYKGVVLDSIIEDRLLADTGKEAANRDLVRAIEGQEANGRAAVITDDNGFFQGSH